MMKNILITIMIYIISSVVFSCDSLESKKIKILQVGIKKEEDSSDILTKPTNRQLDTISFIKENMVKTYLHEGLRYYQFEELKMSYLHNEKDFLFLDKGKGKDNKYILPFSFEIELEILSFRNSKEYLLVLSDVDFYGTDNNFLLFKDNKLYYLGSFFIDEGDRESFENYIPVYFEILKVKNDFIIKTYKNSSLLRTKIFPISNEIIRI